jgi:VWFA-related protein
MIPRGILLCCAAVLVVSTASPQTQPKPTPLAANVDVRVTNVDITVTDGSGKPVDDLSMGDFEIFEDGQPQTITNFSLSRKRAPRSNGPAETPQRAARRKIIVLVDNNYIDSRQRSLALDTLDRFIDDRFDPDSEWSLATIGASLDIVQPLTSDKASLRAAVGRARKSGTVTMRTDALDREVLGDPFRRAATGTGYDYDGTVRFQARERTSRNERALANTTRGLTEATRAYSGVDGKKIIVLLTGGMEMNTSFAAYDDDRDQNQRDRKTSIAKLLEQIVREANSGNLAIYVINVRPRDMAAPQHDVENQAWGGRVGASSTGASDTRDVDSAAFTLAASTGGLNFTSNVVRQSLDALDAMTATYYSLGYAPPHPEDGKYHAITVNLKKPGLHALHRRGYLDISPDEQLEQYLRLRISALQPSSSVEVKVDTESTMGPDGKPIVQITAAMPWQKVTLLRAAEQYKGRVHLYLAIFDKNGATVGFHHRVQDVVLTPDQYTQAMNGAFRYRMAVRLENGEYTLAMTMRDDLSRDIGTGVRKLRL